MDKHIYPPARRVRLAFSMVEILVVVAVVGILTALLTPAIQAAREAARRMRCMANLRQIGHACEAYCDVHQVYPPGALIWYTPYASVILTGDSSNSTWPVQVPINYSRGSILIHILPYIGYQHVYNYYDFNQTVDFQTIPVDGAMTEIRRHIAIQAYVCPSDDHDGRRSDDIALHNYSASMGPTALSSPGSPSCPCNQNWGMYSLPPTGRIHRAGVFRRDCGIASGGNSYKTDCHSACTAPAEITDGLASTIFFGEVRPQCSTHTNAGWGSSNNGNGANTTTVPINYDSCDRTQYGDGQDNCGKYCNWNTEFGYRSLHDRGANFLFGDGSVRFLNDFIDHRLYQMLGAKSDGEPIAGKY